MFENIFKLLSPLKEALPTGESISQIFYDIIEGTDRINERFTQSKQRVTEFSAAIADSTPLVNRLGGTSADVVNIIDSVASATKRNVVASGEEVSKLYAAQKLTGIESAELIKTYENVGIQFTEIGNKLENSIKYIQSVGANARDILKDMNSYVDNINKYNFQDGVLGLTRMATQAQLLKFDMKDVFTFAEKVMTPEGAVEMASAFQRLGVTVGDLTDPFQLMYKSLNDPEGLQNSIVEMTKQFTFFDEKANSFRINPQGMLMLREIGKEVGISSGELSKMALNAADLDKKLSQISPSFDFENEEDKMYIANIAKLGAGGQYQITVKDGNEDRTIPLQEASNEQLRELVQRQREGQKDTTIQDIQKNQLDTLTAIYGEMSAIKNAYLGSVASASKITETLNGISLRMSAISSIRGASEKFLPQVTPREIRKSTNEAIGDASKFMSDFISGDGKKMYEFIKPQVEKLFSTAEKLVEKLPEEISKGFELLKQKSTEVVPMVDDYLKRLTGSVEFPKEIGSIKSGNIIANSIELRNPNEIFASSIKANPIINEINDYRNTFTKVETKTTKVEFGEFSPLKITFGKEPGFNLETTMLEDAITKPGIIDILTQKIKPKFEELQLKDV